MNKDVSWLIVGHYGGSNTGDEAMLHGLISVIPPKQRPQLVVATQDYAEQSLLTAQGITLIPPAVKPVLYHLKQANGLVLGGGTHFHDDYVGLRYWRHYRYMLRFVALSFIARMLGKKVLWLGMGIGPISRATTRWLTQIGLSLCSGITVRESASFNEIMQMKAADKVKLSFDLAALHTLTPKPLSDRANILGISVMSMENLKKEGATFNRLYQQNLTHALNKLLHADPTLQIRIFHIRGGKRESDVEMSHALYEPLHRNHPDRVTIVSYQSDPYAVMAQIGECRAFLATRFHAALLSYLCGCRLMFLAYHRKVNDLAEEIGLHPDAVLPIATHVTSELMYERLTQLVSNDKWNEPTLPVEKAVQRAQTSITVWQKLGGVTT